uniref:Uncharacterized protein n=1 Tax=Trichogramma kaykai TaxID=54128 RepID=A0ABD2XNI2_9HYME
MCVHRAKDGFVCEPHSAHVRASYCCCCSTRSCNVRTPLCALVYDLATSNSNSSPRTFISCKSFTVLKSSQAKRKDVEVAVLVSTTIFPIPRAIRVRVLNRRVSRANCTLYEEM